MERTIPLPEKLVLLEPIWHVTVAMFSFKLDKLFTLLVFELVTVSVEVSFSSEPDFVQKFPSVKSHFVIVMKCPLLANPNP
jgi:hypothetical protein